MKPANILLQMISAHQPKAHNQFLPHLKKQRANKMLPKLPQKNEKN